MKSLKELIVAFSAWMLAIPRDRVSHSDSVGRVWLLRSLNYDKTLKLEDLRTVTDRSSLNDQYVTRYNQTDTNARQGISALKVEISALYSFNKCVVQRYKGRMHFYRDDLSQKGKRNMRTVSQATGIFEEFDNNLS